MDGKKGIAMLVIERARKNGMLGGGAKPMAKPAAAPSRMAAMGGDEDEEEHDGEVESEDGDLGAESAMDDLIAAFAAHDAKAALEAYKALKELC